jgi:broad specificity phosphatase PhoE
MQQQAMVKIYLVRHGENKANLTHEFSHKRVDYPLTPKGRLQAGQTAKYFEMQPVQAVFSSPLLRARETAEAIAALKGLPVEVIENFREINVGELEDRPPTAENWAIHNNVILEWLKGNRDERYPQGENYWEASQRLVDGIHQAVEGLEPGSTCVIVGHGGIFLTGITSLCPDLNILDIVHQISHNCSITEIDAVVEDGQLTGTLLRWADVSHLSGDAADLVSGLPG